MAKQTFRIPISIYLGIEVEAENADIAYNMVAEEMSDEEFGRQVLEQLSNADIDTEPAEPVIDCERTPLHKYIIPVIAEIPVVIYSPTVEQALQSVKTGMLRSELVERMTETLYDAALVFPEVTQIKECD